jgi:hypothetical protein
MTNDTDPDAETAVLSEADVELGSIVHSNSHMDYVVELYRERDRDRPPEKEDYQFGQPVYARQAVDETQYGIFGVVYDTQLVDPDQGRSGPRLAAERQEMFTPGYVQEKRTLLGVALLGYAPLDGVEGGWTVGDPSQDMPPWTLDVDDVVWKLSPDGIRAFHLVDGELSLGYYQRLLDVAGDFGAEVTIALIDRLRAVTDVDADVLDVIERNIRWQSTTDRGVIR